MTLGTKITLVITIMILIFMGLVTLLQYTIISPQFEVMEKRDASEDLRRATEALQREIYHLDLACFDWASWDDTYNYVVDGNSDYVESNLINETLPIMLLT